MIKNSVKISVAAVLMCLFAGCDNAPQMPKPSTYMRLEVENPKYVTLDDNEYPFSFEYPHYAAIKKLDSHNKGIKWFNLEFEKYGFVANVSLIPLTADTSLNASINDCYLFLKRHEKLSGGIVQQDFSNADKKVYSTTFEIKGKDVVSPYQLYITDSTRYFVRISLNSNFVPNNDSCEVVINQLKKDLNHLVTSFSWK